MGGGDACRWEGNRRSGVALAMRHILQWFIHLRVHGLRNGDEHPVYTKGVRRILVRGVNAPLPPEAKKIMKILLRNGAF